RQRFAIGRRHPVVRLDPLVGIDARLELRRPRGILDAGGFAVGCVERLRVHGRPPKIFVEFDIYQKITTIKYYCNMFMSRQTGAPAPDPASAAARFRCWRARQAIVPTRKAA